MKPEINYFISTTIHTRGCNLKCDYCYLSQADYKNDVGGTTLRYPMEHIKKAFSKERIGTCSIEIKGDGETFLPSDVVPLITTLLEEGHYVQVITNGTLTDKIKQLVEWVKTVKKEEYLKFHVSLHYLELKRLNLLDEFAETINYLKMMNVGVEINLTVGGSYIPVIDDIQEYCAKKLEIRPKFNMALDLKKDGTIEILTGKYSVEEYYSAVKRLECDELFEERWENFNSKNEYFCYAGKWAFTLDMTTGLTTQCLANDANKFNFFEYVDKELPLEAVGFRCKKPYCQCGWKDRYNLTPDDTRERKRIYDLSLNKKLYVEEEKKENTWRNILLEDIRSKSVYISRCFYEKDYNAGLEFAEEVLANEVDANNYWIASLVVKYGYILLEVGELDKALDLQCCYEELNYLADYCMMMGCVFLKCGMIQEATRMFEEATEKCATYEEGTNTWLPNYNLGVIYECLGHFEEAKVCYKKCNNYEKAKKRLAELEYT